MILCSKLKNGHCKIFTNHRLSLNQDWDVLSNSPITECRAWECSNTLDQGLKMCGLYKKKIELHIGFVKRSTDLPKPDSLAPCMPSDLATK